MAQFINKAALVAEIERRKNAALMRQQNLEAIGQETITNEMIANELDRIISFLATLEVKEADLTQLNSGSKSQRPQSKEWSEEDEMNFRKLLLYLSCREKITLEVKSKYIAWLESLKQRIVL